MPDFTIFVLLYGDYPDLAQRCLGSVLSRLPAAQFELRILMNAVGPITRACAQQCIDHLAEAESAGVVYEWPMNIKKYPAMRYAFHDPEVPITTPWVMWFDDDSYVTQDAGFLDRVREEMAAADMLGSIYHPTPGLSPQRQDWVRAQPWFAGKAVPDSPRFATGGWWTIRAEILQRFDWPTAELLHNGGDVALGLLCHQQDLRLVSRPRGVAINADAQGRESKARRRGYSEPPIGHDYVNG